MLLQKTTVCVVWEVFLRSSYPLSCSNERDLQDMRQAPTPRWLHGAAFYEENTDITLRHGCRHWTGTAGHDSV